MNSGNKRCGNGEGVAGKGLSPSTGGMRIVDAERICSDELSAVLFLQSIR
jgi:hypothetical protein